MNFMPANHILILVALQSILVSWIILKIICAARPDFLRFFYISSGKSSTNAKLLGGLAISCSALFAISSLLYFFPETLNAFESQSLTIALASIGFVTLYGYIDDKYEVRVRYKLILQLCSIFTFASFSAHNISPEHPVMAFIVLSVLGLALVNGTNLLDGLDTLSVKLGVVSFAAFLYLGIIAHSPATIFLSIISISALSMFYLFNREPARVYMGEIGGSIIGLIYYLQSTICFTELKNQMSMTRAFALILIACCFPIFELGISFIRRLLSKKSPFRGDKLHMHYIIKNKYKYTASKTANVMALMALSVLCAGLLIEKSYGSIFGLSFMILVELQIYLYTCLPGWRENYIDKTAENLFNIFEGKKINIIDSTPFGTLDVSINDYNADKEQSA